LISTPVVEVQKSKDELIKIAESMKSLFPEYFLLLKVGKTIATGLLPVAIYIYGDFR